MPETLFDRASFYYTSCSSTNDMAKQQLQGGRVAEGTVFITGYQVKGRGQRNTIWESSPHQNLLFSLVLYPSYLNIAHLFLLNIITSLAIYQAFESYIPEGLSIKWPNDLYYLDKKLGGILIETAIGANQKIESAIVGIGLNVHQLTFSSAYATSLSLAVNREKEINNALLLNVILTLLGNYYSDLHNNNSDMLRKSYLSKLYRKNEFHLFKTVDGLLEARILTISRLGKLMVENHQGDVFLFNPKEICFLPVSMLF